MSKDKKNMLVPDLRFPEFNDTEGWEHKTLADVCFITNGKSNAQDHIEGGIYPLFDRSEIIKASNDFLFNCEAVIIPGEGMRFIPKYYNGKFDLHQRAYALKDFVSEGKFVYYFMEANTRLLAVKAVQSTVLSLRLPILQNFSIQVPKNKVEQQKIASCLSSLDDLITAHTQKLDALKAHKKGLMQQLFPAEGERVPKLRFEAFREHGEWEQKTVGEIADVTTGGTPESNNAKYWNGNIPWMNSGDLNKKRVYSVDNRITELGLKESSTRLIPLHCVLIGLAGQGKTRGTAAINYIELCTNQSVAAIHPNDDVFVSEFLYQLIDSKYDELRALSTGEGGRGGLNLQIIKTFKISISSKEEQQKIASCLSYLDEFITAQTENIAQLKMHKKGLMQGLFPQIEESN